MFFKYTPAEQLEQLRSEFHESRARVWEDESIPWEKRNAEVDRLWQDFDRQRRELQSAAQEEEATVDEAASPRSPRRSFLPRRARRRQWK